MLKRILIITAIIATTSSFAQDGNVIDVSESEMKNGDVPFAVIEVVPVYPGCDETSNVELKKCMSDNIAAYVNKNFDMKKIDALDLPPKVYRSAVQFKINKEGNVVDVRARADIPEIETEAVRVISNLPQMKPGKQKGEAVGVLYSLPIIFKVEPPRRGQIKKNKQKSKN
ncbi:Gram-negative bacterial tonB protein [Aequorivita sublithincola DSM 14238]|uniref:Gram-negative bacterial tonB protein n=1 Tax=Aequorivita sublithincola (strain DSM 14238 / LMG 21431 / ACAM 643 / 9-3) TaxID=746697 RepID=I3YTA3_AEQSU|nr:energy transducer TonB [Aequorivita sublithincola]AFL80221.1 Gram-negative bacterial tonB protein [Aequorivita sublithincola DSM 14238]